MYAGVSGLRTHQTKMDVIGNNIANVNTVGYKSFNTTFNELAYQNLSGASGASAQGRGGTNAKQIGLGVAMASTTSNISAPGATQSTGETFDLAINGDSFFVVSDGSSNYFTKAGAFTIDGSGNLVMKSTGYTVQGWQVDNNGNVIKNNVSALRVMQERFLTSPPEATTAARIEGVLDMNTNGVNTDNGEMMSLSFFDNRGYSFTANFAIKAGSDSRDTGTYTVELVDIIDRSTQESVLDEYMNADPANNTLDDIFGTSMMRNVKRQINTEGNYSYDGSTYSYTPSGGTAQQLTWNNNNATPPNTFIDTNGKEYAVSDVLGGMTDNDVDAFVKYMNNDPANPAPPNAAIDASGNFSYDSELVAYNLDFNEADGTFNFISGPGSSSVELNLSSLGPNFQNIEIDFSQCKWLDNGMVNSIGAEPGSVEGGSIVGAGKKLGDMNGLVVDQSGMIWASYDNGNTVVLGQIAVASFANPSGLEKVGLNCYRSTLNSGDFDGIGQDISADGGSMSSGVLEMSNVDLSAEFTEMITTQRGFQANSRIITTSDALLEELVNLKR
jgi:flagellar hook protein FlgE